MIHVVSLTDLQSRSGTAQLRIFTGSANRIVDVDYEQHQHSSYTNHVYEIDGTVYEPVYSWDAIKDFPVLGYDSDGWRGFIVPLWDEPDVDVAVIQNIVAEMRKDINFMDLADAIPFEDRLEVAQNFFNPTLVAAVCLGKSKFDISVMYEFINAQLTEWVGDQAKMIKSIEASMAQLGITGIKFV